jgi:hypothetical protein
MRLPWSIHPTVRDPSVAKLEELHSSWTRRRRVLASSKQMGEQRYGERTGAGATARLSQGMKKSG